MFKCGFDYCSELAHHYSLSGNIPKAVEYLHRAAQQAVRHAAHLDAMRHLRAALELLKRLPDTPARARRELTLLLSLGPSLMDVQGYGAPEVAATYTRALQLCEQIGEMSGLFAVHLGLRIHYISRAEYSAARELSERMLRMAADEKDSGLLVEAHSALGVCLFFLGEFAAGREHLERALALYDPAQHQAHVFTHGVEPGIRALNYLALTLWHQGYPDQAYQRSLQALAIARQLAYGPTLAFALAYATELHQLRGEVSLALEHAEAAMAITSDQGLPYWLAWGTALRGWVLARQDRLQEGIAQMREGLADQRAHGGEEGRSYFLALLAESYGIAGDREAALPVLAEAISIATKAGERYYEAELHRLKGSLLLGDGRSAPGAQCGEEAEACFRKALELAHELGAKSLELRAALSLARLWQRAGKLARARAVLAEIYGGFTEGHDTADLREAKALLDELAIVECSPQHLS